MVFQFMNYNKFLVPEIVGPTFRLCASAFLVQVDKFFDPFRVHVEDRGSAFDTHGTILPGMMEQVTSGQVDLQLR